MSTVEHQQPSATQSANDIKSHDDVIKTVSGSGVRTSLHRATSDANPAGGCGARTRDDRRSPTSGTRRGRGASKPVAITHSAPEAAAAAAAAASTAAQSPRLYVGALHGDQHQLSSDSDERPSKEMRHQRKKKQTMSSRKRQLASDSKYGADETSNSAVIVVEPRTVSPPPDIALSYEKAADSSGKTVNTSETSRGTESQEEPQCHETASTSSRRRYAAVEDPPRLKAKSEGQTPTVSDDHSRVSKTSSTDLDQLRLRFQQQRNNAVNFKGELDDLRKMLLDAQKRFSDEREVRRKLEEWTEYLEHELGVYLKSRKNDEKRYMRLLGAAKDVDKFTKFVVQRYNRLHRQLESSCDQPPPGDADTQQQSREHFKESDTSDKQERGVRCGDGGCSFDTGTTAGQHIAARDRVATFARSKSCSASSNDSELLDKNTTSNSNSASTSSKSPVIVHNASWKNLSPENEKDDELSPGLDVRTAWNDRKDRKSDRRNRRRGRNMNASTQTLPTVDELDDTVSADCSEDSGHAQNEQTAARTSEVDLNKDEVQACVAGILRRMLAPALAADRQPTRRSHSPVTVQRCNHLHRHSRHPYHHSYQQHHHTHHHHHQQQHQFPQRRLSESNYNQHNRRPAHSYPSACSSCNMLQADFRDPVVFRSSRGTSADFQHCTCPRHFNPVSGRPVVAFARPSSAALSATSPKSTYPSSTASQGLPPAEPEVHPEESDKPSAASEDNRPLTEKALRQRIERVLVEMVSRKGDEQESKVAAAMRQAIVDSAAFPTLFTD